MQMPRQVFHKGRIRQQIVDFLSETCTLYPGDVILSGTPSGVGMSMEPPQFLQSGDTVRIEIEGLGGIEHGITD